MINTFLSMYEFEEKLRELNPKVEINIEVAGGNCIVCDFPFNKIELPLDVECSILSEEDITVIAFIGKESIEKLTKFRYVRDLKKQQEYIEKIIQDLKELNPFVEIKNVGDYTITYDVDTDQLVLPEGCTNRRCITSSNDYDEINFQNYDIYTIPKRNEELIMVSFLYYYNHSDRELVENCRLLELSGNSIKYRTKYGQEIYLSGGSVRMEFKKYFQKKVL